MTLDRSLQPRCNIGPAEVARRRRSALGITVIAALVVVGLLVIDVPAFARLAAFAFLAGAAVSWAQVVHRFCVAFGAFGIENLGRLGEHHRVGPEQRRADRRRVAQLVLEGSAVGLALTFLLAIAPS